MRVSGALLRRLTPCPSAGNWWVLSVGGGVCVTGAVVGVCCPQVEVAASAGRCVSMKFCCVFLCASISVLLALQLLLHTRCVSWQFGHFFVVSSPFLNFSKQMSVSWLPEQIPHLKG